MNILLASVCIRMSVYSNRVYMAYAVLKKNPRQNQEVDLNIHTAYAVYLEPPVMHVMIMMQKLKTDIFSIELTHFD